MTTRRRITRLLPLLASVLMLNVAPAAPAAEPKADLLGCDPIDPALCLLPFPNDAFTVADPATVTGRRVNLQLTAMPRNIAGKPIDPTDWNRADGFSPNQPIIAKVPGLETPEALAANGVATITTMSRYKKKDQRIVLVNARTGKRHPIWSEVDVNPADPRNRVLIIRPSKNLEEATRYIVALRDLRDGGGAPIEPSAAFKAVRDGEASLHPAVNARRAHMERVFGELAKADIKRSSLHLAWDFTVASERSLAGRMLHIRDQAFAELGDTNLSDMEVQGASPAFTIDSVVDHTPEENSRIFRTVTGTVKVPCWMDLPACPPLSRYRMGPGEDLLSGADDVPQRLPGNTMDAPFECRIPRAAPGSPEPAVSTRPSLYGHGLFGSYGEVEAGNVGKMGVEHAMTFCATDWKGMATEDVPNALVSLLDLSNFPGLADRSQQGMLNFLYLGRLMIHPDGLTKDPAFRAGSEPVLDTSRLFYDGNSQGGIIGGALTAFAPDFDRASLGVPGMAYSILLERSSDYVADFRPDDPQSWIDLVEAVSGAADPAALEQIAGGEIPSGFEDVAGQLVAYETPLNIAYPNRLERQLLYSLIQMLWDRGEANGYANHMTTDPLPNTPPHDVLLHAAFGDHQVANLTAEIEARTIGASILRPTMLPEGVHTDSEPFWGLPEFDPLTGAGSVLVEWYGGTAPAPTTNTRPPETDEQSGRDPHGWPRDTVSARLQKSEFLRIDGRIVDTCATAEEPERPCFSRPLAPSG